jgi:3',5'-cyclic AMP phosphodiesterase CpdA
MKNCLSTFYKYILGLLCLSLIFIPNDVKANPDYFTFAVLPDTQYYSQSYPAIFDQQVQWIVDNAAAQNIVFVSQVGDLVNNNGITSQWLNAQHSMGIIKDAGIPYSVVPGNHDLSYTGDATYFDTYFPYTDFSGYSWYGGNYPSNSYTSNYSLFSAMGQDFIVLNLVCAPAPLANATVWANSILTQYNDRKAIVVTHGYINEAGSYTDSNGTSGIEIWNNIVRLHDNVVAVICGHVHSKYHGTATGTNGNVIQNLLCDTQSEPNGGNGWLRLYKFYPQLNRVFAITYSPFLGQDDVTPAGQFSFDLDMGGSGAAPNITLDTITGMSGNLVTVTGSGFAAGETNIMITFDAAPVSTGISANATGGWSATFVVPGVSAGPHAVSAFGAVTPSGFIPDITFTVGQPDWDLNGDHICNIGDVVVLGIKWGQTGTPGWCPEDISPDGYINIGDVVVLGLHWGQSW